MTAPDDPSTHIRPPRRAGTWIALIIVWVVGVVSWMIYIALIVAVLYRVF